MKKYKFIILLASIFIFVGCSNDVVAKLHLSKIDVGEESEIRASMHSIVERLENAGNDYEKNDYVSLYEEDGTNVTHINGKRISNIKFLNMTVYEVRYEFSDQIDAKRPGEPLLIRAHYFVKPNQQNRTKERMEETLDEHYKRIDRPKTFWVDQDSLIFYEYTPNGQIRIMVEDRDLFEEGLVLQ